MNPAPAANSSAWLLIAPAALAVGVVATVTFDPPPAAVFVAFAVPVALVEVVPASAWAQIWMAADSVSGSLSDYLLLQLEGMNIRA
jgi:hypothetical protein